MYDNTIKVLKEKDIPLLIETLKLEDKADDLCKEFSNAHVKRLENGTCSVESGIIFLNIITHFERIADHIYKICLASKDELQGIPRNN